MDTLVTPKLLRASEGFFSPFCALKAVDEAAFGVFCLLIEK